jgi:hypothetical protein
VHLHVLRAGVVELDDRRALVEARLGEALVDGDARDERVVLDRVGEELRGRTDDAGDVARRIDDSVPAAPFERPEVAAAVAAQVLRLGEEVRVRPAPVEERQLVPAVERRVCDRPPEKLRPAEQQELQSSASAASSPSTSSAVL